VDEAAEVPEQTNYAQPHDDSPAVHVTAQEHEGFVREDASGMHRTIHFTIITETLQVPVVHRRRTPFSKSSDHFLDALPASVSLQALSGVAYIMGSSFSRCYS